MTHLLFLYLLKYKKLYDDGKEITFDNNEILQYGQHIDEDKIINNAQQ
jgi:hypothetical protein